METRGGCDRGADTSSVKEAPGLLFRSDSSNAAAIDRSALEILGVSSAVTVASPLAPEVLDKNAIGFDSVQMKVKTDAPQWSAEELAEYRRAVIRLKQKDQLYQKSDYGVAFIGRSLFRSTISLPANVPVGPLIVHTYLFRDGELLSKHSNPVKLQREGLERYLHTFAFDYPMFYGIFAVFLAVVAGLIASAVFKRGSH